MERTVGCLKKRLQRKQREDTQQRWMKKQVDGESQQELVPVAAERLFSAWGSGHEGTPLTKVANRQTHRGTNQDEFWLIQI